MNRNIYDIDFTKAAIWLTPKRLRKSRMVAWVKILMVPFVWVYQDFLKYRKAKLYQLMITPQVCYLERLLNDRYDYTQRRIYITDGVDKPPTYIYQSTELKPLYIYNRSESKPKKYIYTAGESGDLKDDFIVWVPADLVFEEAEMISLVKVYKLAGTKFKVQRAPGP